jgi:hypothetical protein
MKVVVTAALSVELKVGRLVVYLEWRMVVPLVVRLVELMVDWKVGLLVLLKVERKAAL